MQRITITIEDDLLAEIDAAAKDRGYQNRSEIIRDLTRAGLQQSAQEAAPSGQCVAALVYVYDHAARDLSKRLVQNFHGHHDLSLATLHVHLDDDSCMEVTALKGASSEVQHFADHIIAERGVRYGKVVMIPTATGKKKRARQELRTSTIEAIRRFPSPRPACGERSDHIVRCDPGEGNSPRVPLSIKPLTPTLSP